MDDEQKTNKEVKKNEQKAMDDGWWHLVWGSTLFSHHGLVTFLPLDYASP
jgi:hypothetical protein